MLYACIQLYMHITYHIRYKNIMQGLFNSTFSYEFTKTTQTTVYLDKDKKIDQIKLNQLTTKQQTARTGVCITMYYKIYSICLQTGSRKNRVKMLVKDSEEIDKL